MYEMSLNECRRRRGIVAQIRGEIDQFHRAEPTCSCFERAKAAQPGLIEILNAGDELAVESILSFYQGCIDSWAKDIYHDPVYESHFKAEIAAKLVQDAASLNSDTLCRQLKFISVDIVDDHLKHIERFHLSQLVDQSGATGDDAEQALAQCASLWLRKHVYFSKS